MSRLKILIGCIILSIFSLSAQEKVGIVAGLNFSNAEFSIKTKTEPNTNYFAGVLISFYSNQKFRLNSKLLYSLKGYSSQSNSSRFSYLDLGLITEYKVINPIWIGLGITYSYNLDEFEKVGTSPWRSIKPFKSIKGKDVGISISMRVDFKDFYLFVMYERGIIDISNLSFTDINGNPIEGPKQFNRNLQIGIGYNFL